MSDESAPMHRFSCLAMRTTFEIVIRGWAYEYARQAARNAFDEMKRTEEELSRFISHSDVSQINRLRAGESLRVGVATYDCLRLARKVYEETGGAFDPTIGALLQCWRAEEGALRAPTDEEIASARMRTGMNLVRIDETEHSVGLLADGVEIDLGGIGKGYAVDQMAALLQEWSIEDALIHAGESSVLAMGAWVVAVRDPRSQQETLERVCLQGRSLSGSGLLLHGAHIIDPRSGRPAENKNGAWAMAPSAAESDALSTAFMVMSSGEVEAYCRRHVEVSALLVMAAEGGYNLIRCGAW